MASSVQLHPLGYESKLVTVSSGHNYRYVDVHPPKGVETIATALLIHGFPDSAYGWRHQVKGWSQRGIRLIIPDVIGYTGSSQPTDPNEYRYKLQSDDLADLVHSAGLNKDEKIVVIAHDWGSAIGMRMAQYKPDLVKGMASLCIPFFPSERPGKGLTLKQWAQAAPSFEYQLFFASPHADALIDSNVEKFINLIYSSAKQYASGEAPQWEKAGVIEAWLKDDSKNVVAESLSKEELETIVSQIKAGVGFSAMLNYYRTREINYETDQNLPEEMLPHTPKLMVIPSADPAIPVAVSEHVDKQLKAIEVVSLDGLCGHWVQLERPREIERIVGEWVEKWTRKDGHLDPVWQ